MDSETNQQFSDLNKRFDDFQSFLIEHLVTKQDLKDAIEDLPTKADFSSLASTVDGYAKQVKDTSQEIIILGEKANRLEAWAKQVSTKLGVEYRP
jgi:chromosome segregation ATPase